MSFEEKGYKYIFHIIKNSNINKNLMLKNCNFYNLLDGDYNMDFYDLISVVFKPCHYQTYIHEFELEPFGEEIKISDIDDFNKLETNHVNNTFKHSPYLLVKLPNNKYGYIHVENFDPIEFADQDKIINKLLNFLIVNNSP